MDYYAEIACVLSRIMFAVDHEDRAAFADCWSDDTRLELNFVDGRKVVYSNRAELVCATTAHWAGRESALRHQLGSLVVDVVDENTVRAQSYGTYYLVGEQKSFAGMGEYFDLIVREADGRWRVRDRKHNFLTPMHF